MVNMNDDKMFFDNKNEFKTFLLKNFCDYVLNGENVVDAHFKLFNKLNHFFNFLDNQHDTLWEIYYFNYELNVDDLSIKILIRFKNGQNDICYAITTEFDEIRLKYDTYKKIFGNVKIIKKNVKNILTT